MNHLITLFISLFFLFSSFKSHEEADQLRNSLINTFNKVESEKLLGSKSSKLDVTKDGFVRYTKVLKNNKSEYYSFKLTKFIDVDFIGSERTGVLTLKCEEETVIFQSFRDPKGDVDSMTNKVSFRVSNISAEDLNLLKGNLYSLKSKLIIRK